MDRPGVQQVPEGSGQQAKMEKTGCKIICGAPTTLAVKGLMKMMMNKDNKLTSQTYGSLPPASLRALGADSSGGLQHLGQSASHVAFHLVLPLLFA